MGPEHVKVQLWDVAGGPQAQQYWEVLAKVQPRVADTSLPYMECWSANCSFKAGVNDLIGGQHHIATHTNNSARHGTVCLARCCCSGRDVRLPPRQALAGT
eukprot:GHUV01016034.1.p2 GENE.GHUV01016034.1~~GHUV01016034.1.p2  ORF type:complete len:101 (+),score=20.08 GHUV01016034.1:511-813(+)